MEKCGRKDVDVRRQMKKCGFKLRMTNFKW